VKTALSSEQATALLRHYNLKLRGLWPLLRGTINSNFVVETDAGPLFLRVNEGKSEADAAFEAAFIWHLGSRGVPTPALWRTRTGAPSVPLPGELAPRGGERRPVMLMSWVEGEEQTDEALDAKGARRVGEHLAQLHLAGSTFDKRRPGIYTLRHITQRLSRVYADERARTDLGAELNELTSEAGRLMTARRADLPSGMGHGDLFPDNYLFSCHGDNILDLEQVATVPYVYDLAVSLLAFCAPVPIVDETSTEAPRGTLLGPLRLPTARALCDGYQAYRALSSAERLGFCEELRFAALRFTVTRLTDVHGYGHAPVPAPPATPSDEARPEASAEAGPRPPRWLRKSRPSHSKDYRDFLWRLRGLSSLEPAALASGLF
jgi:homoserine kinase type II